MSNPEYDPNVAAALYAYLLQLKTEPLTTDQLRQMFGCTRNTVKNWMGRIEGVERIGRGKYRVPLHAMPAPYLESEGTLHKLAQKAKTHLYSGQKPAILGSDDQHRLNHHRDTPNDNSDRDPRRLPG